MPRVPTYQPGQVAPVQSTQTRFRAPDNPGGMGLIAEALGGAARVLNAQDKINLENDQTQARQAIANARVQLAGQFDQYKTTRLGAARAGQQGYDDSVDKIASDTLATASNPRMRRMMELELHPLQADYRRMGAGHSLEQSRDETDNSFKVEQQSLIDTAAGSDDPAFRDQQGLALRDSVRRQLAFAGFDEKTTPDAYSLAEKDAMSKLHAGVLDRMFSNPDPNLDEVGQYLTAYHDEMTSDLYTKTLARMQGPLQDRIDDSRADLIHVVPTTGEAPKAAGPWQNVAVNVANRFGLDPTDVAAVMSYETGGTFSPTRMGGTGGNYMGLIQFGPAERKKYGITKESTPEQWTTAIGDYLHDRGFKRGMGMLDLYSTINAGTPGRYNASDGNGTVTSHVGNILGAHKEKAKAWLGGAGGYSPAPRDYDRPEIYRQVEEAAAREGWSPEAAKRVKAVWDRRMSTDQGLLRDQQRSADDAAKTIALQAGDNFKVSMLPASVRATLSPLDLAQYEAAEARINKGKAEAAAEARGQTELFRLGAMQRLQPDAFKNEDLRQFMGVIPAGQLNSLALTQAQMRQQVAPRYDEVNFRSAISSEIEFQEKHNGVKLSDEQKVHMFDYMSALLSQVTDRAGKLPDKKAVAAMFQSGNREVQGTSGWFSGPKRQFEILTDVPADFRQRFADSWRSGGRNGDPLESQVVSAYQQWKYQGGR